MNHNLKDNKISLNLREQHFSINKINMITKFFLFQNTLEDVMMYILYMMIQVKLLIYKP